MTGQAARAGGPARGGGDGSAWTRASLREDLLGIARERGFPSIQDTRHWPLSQWRARSAVAPPRSIPNRVVKRGSAEGTGGRTAGRLGPCALLARRGAVAARRAHNPKVDGSNPSAATNNQNLQRNSHSDCWTGGFDYPLALSSKVGIILYVGW